MNKLHWPLTPENNNEGSRNLFWNALSVNSNIFSTMTLHLDMLIMQHKMVWSVFTRHSSIAEKEANFERSVERFFSTFWLVCCSSFTNNSDLHKSASRWVSFSFNETVVFFSKAVLNFSSMICSCIFFLKWVSAIQVKQLSYYCTFKLLIVVFKLSSRLVAILIVFSSLASALY